MELSFNTVLIANCGEIACRLIRSCRELGLKSVAVYSDADAAAEHVTIADVSVRIGPAQPKDSYLNTDALIQACKDTAAKAVLPGYGFVSMDLHFVKKCAENDIIFIGPTVENMSIFAFKDKARKLASFDVPLLPGSPILKSVEEAIEHAKRIGYPILLKGTAAGGGIGTSLCRNEAKLKEVFNEAIHLAFKNFGNGDVYIEQFVESSRHIEVQVFGDKNGKIRCLGERECSIQRRYQKVIEETPSPFMVPSLQDEMFRAAKRLCEGIGYQSAGTVEFLVDHQTSKFYFLEVNTRLQVEHGVTEMVSKIDIVQWMIRLAGNDPTFSVVLDNYIHRPIGSSIECRIYAEDPTNNFRPCTGTVTDLSLPELLWARFDNWVVIL